MKSDSFVSRRRQPSARMAAVVAVVAVSIAACSGGTGSSGGDGDAASVTIGSIMPLSGEQGATGGACQAGIDAAVGAANAQGGANGHMITLQKVDDAFQVPKTITGMKQLAQHDDAVGIIGPLGTSASAAIPPVADSLAVPIVGPYGFTDVLYKPTHPTIFALWPGTEAATQAQTTYAINELGAKSVAVIANNGQVGNETLAGVEAAAKKAGVPVVSQQRADNGNPSYTGVMAQVKETNPGALILQATPATIGSMIAAARQVGMNVPILGGFGAADSQIAKAAGAGADGVLGLAPVALTPDAPGWADYEAAVTKYASSADPASTPVGACHVAASILIQAIAEVPEGNPITAESVTDALNSNTFTTLAGDITFTEDDHLGSPQVFLTKIQNGTLVSTGESLPLAQTS